MTYDQQIVIAPRSGLRIIDWKELVEYRDLFRFLVWRGLKARYAQSALGVGWAVIQPVFTTVVFTIVFGNLAKMDSQGLPYILFNFTALTAWTYFANSVTESTNSLIGNASMISKIYFPRMILPLTAVISKLVDFAIACAILTGLMIYFQKIPTVNVLFLPFLIVLMMMTAAGIGMWLTSLAIQYRDVKHASTFFIQLLMYASPVVYPLSKIPVDYQHLYALNPLVGVIEGFRSALFYTPTPALPPDATRSVLEGIQATLAGPQAMPWHLILVGTETSLIIFLTGALYFAAKEKIFADVA